MEGAEEICKEFGIVRDVLEAADRLEFASQMIGYFAERSFKCESAVPSTAVIAVEAIAARPRMRERGVDEGVAGPPKDEFARMEIGKAGLLRLEAAIGYALQIGQD